MKVTCPHSQIIQILFLINKSMPKCHFLIYIYIYHIHAHMYSARCNQDEKTGVYLCCFDPRLYQH